MSIRIGPTVSPPGAFNVQSYGALGDGSHDDTDAIEAALEAANGIAVGTWASGNDPYVGWAARTRSQVFFPPGIYKTTRSIPIRFRGVVIQGPQSVGPFGGQYEGQIAKIFGDHNNAIFAVNATYNVNGFSIQNLQLDKRNAYIGNGDGIGVTGPNYVFGLTLDGVQVQHCDNGVYIITQDAGAGSGGMADLVIKDCMLANNTSWGLRLIGHASVSSIHDSQIVANGVGGISCGLKGASVRRNDLEGQPRPLEINAGTASTNVTVENNYFEETVAAATKACIWFETCTGFTVKDNVYSGANNGVPKAGASSCLDGSFDTEAVVRGSTDIDAVKYVSYDDSGASTTEVSVALNLAKRHLPMAGPELGSFTSMGGESGAYSKISGVIRNVSLIDAAYRKLFGGIGTITNGQRVYLCIPIRYESEIPHSNPIFQLLGTLSGTPDIRYSWSLDVQNIEIGDTVLYVLGWQNNLGSSLTSCSVYVQPYGTDTTVGSGARVAVFPVWKNSLALIRASDVMGLISPAGVAAPTSGTWAVGDIVYNSSPEAGGNMGWVCTGAGTPGTWKPFGNIGL
jgi:hypothetical protein